MRSLFFIICFAAMNLLACKQASLSDKAADAYEAKEYQTAALLYSEALATSVESTDPKDRFNAARSWAMINQQDSAFHQLLLLMENGDTAEFGDFSTDEELSSLYGDERWKILEMFADITPPSKNVKREENLNQELIAILDSVEYNDQQRGRERYQKVIEKYGSNSDEFMKLKTEISHYDSLNTIIVSEILDTYGWLGKEVIGSKGNSTLFLVIQHSDLATKQKYFPMMREAVEDGRANRRQFAMLEDRVALFTGKPQIYGSQIRSTPDGRKYVGELIEPEKVNERRKAALMLPIEGYTKHFGFDWDVERHKRVVAEMKAVKVDEKE